LQSTKFALWIELGDGDGRCRTVEVAIGHLNP